MITLSQHIAFCLLTCPWVLHRTLHILSNDPNMEWILTHDTHIKKKKKVFALDVSSSSLPQDGSREFLLGKTNGEYPVSQRVDVFEPILFGMIQ